MPTSLFVDCQRFGQSVTAAGGQLPPALANLLSSYEVLSRPPAAQPPERDIMSAALAGDLTAAKLAELLPVAAAAHSANQYRQQLAKNSEHTLTGEWHRRLANGGADAILDSVRDRFTEHAEAIAAARELIDPESSIEQVLASGRPELVVKWQELPQHLAVVSKIGAIAAQFGCQAMTALFPQIVQFSLGDNVQISDTALMCGAGGLVTDSAAFLRPDRGHRDSPWFRVPLRLNTIAQAQARYDEWAAAEWEAVNSGPPTTYIGEDGQQHEIAQPENPYRATTLAKG